MKKILITFILTNALFAGSKGAPVQMSLYKIDPSKLVSLSDYQAVLPYLSMSFFVRQGNPADSKKLSALSKYSVQLPWPPAKHK